MHGKPNPKKVGGNGDAREKILVKNIINKIAAKTNFCKRSKTKWGYSTIKSRKCLIYILFK